MSKTEEAVKYMISVWDEVQGNWRDHPDYVQQKFLNAEKELNNQKIREVVDSVLPIDNTLYKDEIYEAIDNSFSATTKYSEKERPYLVDSVFRHLEAAGFKIIKD